MTRLRCVVPFCRRTRKLGQAHPDSEWICGVHWPLTSRDTRRLYFKVRRARKRDPARDLWPLQRKLWMKLKTQAIERATGI